MIAKLFVRNQKNVKIMMQCSITPSFCNDPRDAYFIKLGALAYDAEHKE